MAEELGSPQIVFAKSLGVSRRKLVYGYALKSALVPLLPQLVSMMIGIFSGSFIVEQIFSVQDALPAETWSKKDFVIADGVLYKYVGTDAVVTIPGVVHTIDNEAFRGCSSLTCVAVPNSVETIGASVFSCCNALQTVSLSKNITEIPRYAFCGCTALTDVEIPDSVTSIGEYAFEDCSSLTQITYQGTMQQWEQVKLRKQPDCALKHIRCIDGVVEWNL